MESQRAGHDWATNTFAFFKKTKLSSIANGKSDIEIEVTKESSQKVFEGTELKSLSGYSSFIH